MSANNVEYYSKLPGLHMQAKLRFPCHVWEPIKLANVRGAGVSASVQLFISSFLTHFHILMRWHSSSRIRTVGCIIVCLIWSSPAVSILSYQGVWGGRWKLWWVWHVHTMPPPLCPQAPHLWPYPHGPWHCYSQALLHLAALSPCFLTCVSVELGGSSSGS